MWISWDLSIDTHVEDLLITEPALNLVKCCNELNIGYARGVGVCVVTFTVNALFNGRYVVLVAYMSVTSLLENPVLQDYLQPVVTSVDSVLEKDHDVDKMQEKAHNYEKEQTQPQESTCPPSTVDLTKDDDGLDSGGSWNIVERKPTLTSIHSQSDTPTVGNSELPVLLDTISPTFSQQFTGCDNNLVVNSAMHNQFSRPNNLQM
ncbi:hypothetical protein JHK82_039851 [Glycine max]|nr:hypothetical protein JHK86_040048 [Glycine max]KAG5110628.1 hypothetical protein JHK82_039851 [Glycine max]KAG5121917.1 hypothetical protein JHK84_040257 [Glycine max]